MTERTHTYRNGVERDTYKSYEIRVFRRNGYWAVMVRTGHHCPLDAGGYATYIGAKQTGIAFIDNWFETMNKIWRFES